MNISNEVKLQEKYIEKVKKINNNRNFKYMVFTMGCQLNENDSEKIAGMLTDMGYLETNKQEEANIFIINTCCVRENAEEKLFRKTWRIKKN